MRLKDLLEKCENDNIVVKVFKDGTRWIEFHIETWKELKESVLYMKVNGYSFGAISIFSTERATLSVNVEREDK